MKFDAVLENEIIRLLPLKLMHFEELYTIASDKEIWEQHPQNDRWKREVFEIYFNSAIESNSAFLILSQNNNQIIGCTRYYEFNENEKSIAIGYTFLAKKFWGGFINSSLKKLMINYAFGFVDKIYFHVGAQNIRSQKAIEKLGALLVKKEVIPLLGKPDKINLIYCLNNTKI
jgi:RimJ/RimL family protein N-acetyltransferase